MQKVLVQAVAALALLPDPVWAQAPSDAERYGWGPHMMGWGGGWYGMIFGPLFMILFLAVWLPSWQFLSDGWAGHGTVQCRRISSRPFALRSIFSRSALPAVKSTRRNSRTGGVCSASNAPTEGLVSCKGERPCKSC